MTDITYRLTAQLRWVNRRQPHEHPTLGYVEHGWAEKVLQQGWLSLQTGDIEWRDVPTEAE